MQPKEIGEILTRAADKWDITEGVLKQTETLTGDAVAAAMFELRYAGRQLVDAVRESVKENPDFEKVRLHVLEVEQNCHRAYHDAIDATVWYLREFLALQEKTFGVDILYE